MFLQSVHLASRRDCKSDDNDPSNKDSAMLHRQFLGHAKALVAIGAIATLGACADSNTVAPTTQEQVFHAPANFTQVGTSVVFRVNNSDGVTQEIGEHI